MLWMAKTKTLVLPIKGTFYYSADQSEKAGLLIRETRLSFLSEPDNPYDSFAVQIWQNAFKRFLLGYIPRTHSKQITFLMQRQCIESIELSDCYREHNRLFIDCQICYRHTYLLSLLYVWYRLKSFNQMHRHFHQKARTQL